MKAGLIGGAIAALVALPGLGLGTLWDNSETTYGEIAREILLTGNWIVMHLNGRPSFVQPPLYFWIAAVFSSALGPTALAMRLPSALATTLMGFFTAYAVARQVGERVGIYSGIVLSCSLMQVIIGRLAIMDALLDAAVAMTIFWWFQAFSTGRNRYVIYGAIASACGFLAKGPVAPVVAVLVIAPYVLWSRRFERSQLPAPWSWVIGGLVLAFVVAPWFLAIAWQVDTHAVGMLLGRATIMRYSGVIENQSGPFWYYVPVVILGLFPWTAFIPATVPYCFGALRASNEDPGGARLMRLCVCWAIVPFLFFSAARTKLPNYVALELPAFAVLVALYFDSVVRRSGTRAAAVSAATVPATVGLLAVAVWIFARNNRLTVDLHSVSTGLIATASPIFLGSLVAAVLFAGPAARFAPYALGTGVVVAFTALSLLVLPQAERYKPVPRLAAVIQRDREPGDVVAIQSFSGSNALLFYSEPPVHVLAPNEALSGVQGESPRAVLCASPRAWLIAPRDRQPEAGPERRHHVVATDGRAALILYDGTTCGP